MGIARQVIGSVRGAAMRTSRLPKQHVAAVLTLALVLMPVRDGVGLALAVPSADGQGYGPARRSERPPGLKVTSTAPRPSGPLSSAQERGREGERPSRNLAAIRRAKEAAEKASRGSRGGPADSPSLENALGAARSASAGGVPRPAPQASPEGALTAPAPAARGDAGVAGVPTTIISSLGQSDPDGSFTGTADAAVAAGPDRYIQVVNQKFGIYAYTSGTPIAQGALYELADVEIGGAEFGDLSSPQIIWDADTSRFYYATALILGPASYVAFGFSKTATPASADDFCHYFLFPPPSFGALSTVSLGDTQNRLLIGHNKISPSNNSSTSELYHITKPPAGSICPELGSFGVGGFGFVMSGLDNVLAHSLAVANQIDGSTTGYAVSSSQFLFTEPTTTALTVYKLEESGADMTMLAAPIAVPAYAIPADAEQPGTTNRLDTGFGGPTQAVSAIDPERGGTDHLWTQHTVLGGAGAAVRWYEINPVPVRPSIVQSGEIAAPSAYLFNAAISPDRVAVGTTRRFGSSMGLGLNASATNLKASVITASKVGDGAIGYKFVALSPAVLNDFTCINGVCAWGHYAGASPAPINAPNWTRGLIVHTTNFVQTAGSPAASGWGTLNMYVIPQ